MVSMLLVSLFLCAKQSCCEWYRMPSDPTDVSQMSLQNAELSPKIAFWLKLIFVYLLCFKQSDCAYRNTSHSDDANITSLNGNWVV